MLYLRLQVTFAIRHCSLKRKGRLAGTEYPSTPLANQRVLRYSPLLLVFRFFSMLATDSKPKLTNYVSIPISQILFHKSSSPFLPLLENYFVLEICNDFTRDLFINLLLNFGCLIALNLFTDVLLGKMDLRESLAEIEYSSEKVQLEGEGRQVALQGTVPQ